MNIVEETLKKYILDTNTVFVFNTDVAVNSWTDYIVRKGGTDGWPQSVAQERFLAWDAFKGQTLKIQQEGFETIPSLLRKFFARGLLERIKKGEKVFERLINSEYKENALAFTDWLCGLLPYLGRWKKLAQKFMAGTNGANGAADPCAGKFIGERDNPENRDFLRLYNEYEKFLREKKLFEPAWQKAAFDASDKKTYAVFFPELLDDFDEYKDILKEAQKSGRVILIEIPQGQEPAKAQYWESARLELRMTALKILKENAGGTDWNDMALCVADIENLRPYVERELKLYQIPFVTRAGIKLGKSGAGRVFRKMQDCAQNNFSYQSVRSLILDSTIPWKNPQDMELLARLGKEAKCLVQYTDQKGNLVDPWLMDLEEGVKKDSDGKEFLSAQKFYKALKDSIKKIAQADSFAKIKKGWINFRNEFLLDEEQTDQSANDILSRSVALMDQLIILEEKFPQEIKGRADNYSFFLNELENTQYQSQSKKRGVSIYDYKVSALAAIKKQFVINASQEKITVEKIPLSFVSPKERAFLADQGEADHSKAYIDSYAICSNADFSASQNALGGYAIVHSALLSNERPLEADASLDAIDFIKREKEFFSKGKEAPKEFTAEQKNSFERFAKRNGDEKAVPTEETKEYLFDAIERKTKKERGARDGTEDKIHITASDLKEFFPCPRKWIFKRLLAVNEFSLDTDLFEVYDQGSVNHKILELYFKALKEKSEPIPLTDKASGKILGQDGLDFEEKILLPQLEAFAAEAFKEAKAYKKSGLVQEALKSQDKLFAKAAIKFLRDFCKQENFGGWTVQETEWGNGMDLDLPPILQGRMDLVLRSPQGQVAIIDYKNTKAPDGEKTLKRGGEELEDFQIAAYVSLWENKNPDQEDQAAKASFVTIKNFSETKVISPDADGRGNAVKREDFGAALASLKRRAALMAQCLESKTFSQEKVRARKDCNKCSYSAICRTTY